MVQNLLASVYRYYSVGLSQFSHVYPGASEIRKIVDAKINDVISCRAGEWERVIEDVKKECSQDDVLNMSYLSVPSYTLKIKGFQESDLVNTSLVASVSLLSKHFTLYFEDTHHLASYESIDETGTDLRVLYSTKQGMSTKETSTFLALKKSINKHFPEHEFVNHVTLFKTRIEGIRPYPDFFVDLISSSASLYELLFDGVSPLHNLKILK